MNKYEYDNYIHGLIKHHKSNAAMWPKLRIILLVAALMAIVGGAGNIYVLNKSFDTDTYKQLMQKSNGDTVSYIELKLYAQKEKCENAYVYLAGLLIGGFGLLLYVLANWKQYISNHLLQAQMLEYFISCKKEIEQIASASRQ